MFEVIIKAGDDHICKAEDLKLIWDETTLDIGHE